MKLKKFGVMSLAKVEAVLLAVVFCIEGFFFFLISLLGGTTGAVIGLMIWIGLTIGGVIFGFIAGALIALVYNFVAGKVGGIEMEFDQ